MDKQVETSINEWFEQFPLRKYRAGQVLILNGDTPDKVFLLIKGRVKMYDVNYRGDEIILQIFKPPAFFPMSYALNGGISPYIFEAETDIEIRQAASREVVDLLERQPDITFDLLKRLYRGTDVLLGRITQLAAGSAKHRVAFELLIEARRFGKSSDKLSYEVDITEKDLAARAGLSRETVSRELQKLKTDGLISYDKHKFTLPDLPKIEHWLGIEK